jgi:hypothetical protein
MVLASLLANYTTQCLDPHLEQLETARDLLLDHCQGNQTYTIQHPKILTQGTIQQWTLRVHSS